MGVEKAKMQNEMRMAKKETEIDNMSVEEVLNEMKMKKIPTFGTPAERKDRLKRALGLRAEGGPGAPAPIAPPVPAQLQPPTPVPAPFPSQPSGAGAGSRPGPGAGAGAGAGSGAGLAAEGGYGDMPKVVKKSGVVDRIEEMKQKRENRRKKMEDDKKMKIERQEENLAAGKLGDVEFEMMIEKHKLKPEARLPHVSPEGLKINVCVRKRPIFKKEQTAGEIECISVANPDLIVHECNYRVDGITKYVEDHKFRFDNVRQSPASRHFRNRSPQKTFTCIQSSHYCLCSLRRV